MLRTIPFLGFSMVRRHNRRLLVATTYTTLLVLMATVIVIFPSGRQMSAVWMCSILAFDGAIRAIFGRLVKNIVLPGLRRGGLTSLGLAASRHRGQDEPDEREVTVRNAACFQACRALAVYSLAICVAWPLFLLLTPSIALQVLQLLFIPLLAMALTLSQAVVLWTESDVPEEAIA